MIKENIKNGLFLFWGMHPDAKFSIRIVGYALDYNKTDLNRALEEMVATGLVDTDTQDGVDLYSLTTNEEKRKSILEFARYGYN